MTRTLARLLVVAASTMFFASPRVHAQHAPIPSKPRTVVYTIKEGDTCMSIATGVLGSRDRWRLIHEYNPNMGLQPHRLKVGETLVLPVLRRADAHLTSMHRLVTTREPQNAEWNRAKLGEELYRGWRVNTESKSTAEVTFRDDSAIEMRENTLVIIYGNISTRTQQTRQTTTTATLERGVLRSKLGELRLSVTTANSEVELENGESIVEVNAGGDSLVSSHKGTPAKLRTRSAEVSVEPGFGSKVRRGERTPIPPVKLPNAPEWRDGSGPQSYLATSKGGATVSGRWDAVDAAAAYQVELRALGANKSSIAAPRVDKAVTSFEVQGIPPGEYDVFVSAIDANGFESPLSQPLRIYVTGAQLLSPSSDASLSDPSSDVMAGTQVTAPTGWLCTTGNMPAANPLVLTRAGTNEVSCSSSDAPAGAPPARMTFNVVHAQVEASGVSPEKPLARDTSTPITVNVTASPNLPSDLRLVSLTPGIIVQPTALRAGTNAVVVTPTDNLSGEATEASLQVVSGAIDNAVVHASITAPLSSSKRSDTLSEGLGLAMSPQLMSLTDDRRVGSSVWMGVSNHGNKPGSRDYWRSLIGGEAEFAHVIRVGVAAAFDFARDADSPTEVGDRDLYAYVSARAVDLERVSLSLDLATWFPFDVDSSNPGGLQRVRYAPSVSVSLKLCDCMYLRTRQGGSISSSTNGYRAWTSAYGADWRIVRGLTLGAEADLAIGTEFDDHFVMVGAGGGLSYMLRPLVFHVGARYGITDSFQERVGRVTVTASIRAFFD